MKRLIAALTLAGAAFVSSEAQQLKFGHVNSQDLMMSLDEVKQVDKTLQEQQGVIENQIVVLQEEFTKLQNETQKALDSKTLTDAEVEAKQAELQEMYEKIMMFRNTSMQELQQKQQELLTPIILKIRRAIEEVGQENGYLYIFDGDQNGLVYLGQQSTDRKSVV